MSEEKKPVDLNALFAACQQQKPSLGARPKERTNKNVKSKRKPSPTATPEDAHLDRVLDEIQSEAGAQQLSTQTENLNVVYRRQNPPSTADASSIPSGSGKKAVSKGTDQGASAAGLATQASPGPGKVHSRQPASASARAILHQPAAPHAEVEMSEMPPSHLRQNRPERRLILPQLAIKDFAQKLEREKRKAEVGGDPFSVFEAQCTVFLVDTSESMRGAPIEKAKKLIRKFINEGMRGIPPVREGQGPQVQTENLALIGFGSRQFSILQHLTSDSDKILCALDHLEIGGCTPLNEALVLALTAIERVPRDELRKHSIRPRILVISDFYLSYDPDDEYRQERENKELLPATLTVAGMMSRYYEVSVNTLPVGENFNKDTCEQVWVHGHGEGLNEETFFLWSRHGMYMRVANALLFCPENIDRGSIPTVRKFADRMGFGQFMGKDHTDEVNEKCILNILARRVRERLRFYDPSRPNFVPSDVQDVPILWDLLPPFEYDPLDSSDDEPEIVEEPQPDPGPPLPIMPRRGTKVVKGWDWMWRSNDIPDDAVGEVKEILEDPKGWLLIKWNTGQETECRYGVDKEFDVIPQNGGPAAIEFQPGEGYEVIEPEIPDVENLPSPQEPEEVPQDQQQNWGQELQGFLQAQGGNLQNLLQQLQVGGAGGGIGGLAGIGSAAGRGGGIIAPGLLQEDGGEMGGRAEERAERGGYNSGISMSTSTIPSSPFTSGHRSSLGPSSHEPRSSLGLSSHEPRSSLGLSSNGPGSLGSSSREPGSSLGSSSQGTARGSELPESSLSENPGTYIWQWKDKHGQWRNYREEVIKRLETHYRKNPRTTCLIQPEGQHWVRVMFSKMKQRNDEDHFESDVRRIEVDPEMEKNLLKAMS